MLIFALLIAAQQQPALSQHARDSVYATPRLDSLVQRAADANSRIPEILSSYRARVETEVSLVLMGAEGRETVGQVEQVASNLYWRSDGGLLQEVVGYRSQTTFPWYSFFGYIRVPTMVPALYGERLDLVRIRAPRSASAVSPEAKHPVHPFSAARDRYYQFSGGDTVQTIVVDGRDVPVVRIRVAPHRRPSVATMLFNGDIDVDVARMHIVRMRGRIVLGGPDPPFNDAVFQGNMFVEFENAEHNDQYWLPREQRWELQAAWVAFSESRAVVRVITRFIDIQTNDSTAERMAASPDTFPYGRIDGRGDQRALSAFKDWHTPLGALSDNADARDFDQYAPRGVGRAGASGSASASTGMPSLSFGTRYFSQMLRYNDIEGVYSGAGARLDFGTLAPGLMLRAHAGWAWREQTARGGVDLAQRRGAWEFIARGERQLAAPNNLTAGTKPEPGVLPLIGDDRYFDRRSTGIVARTVRAHGLAWRLEVSRASDRVAGRGAIPFVPLAPGEPIIPPPPADSSLTRAVFEGGFWLTRAEIHLNPSGGISFQRRVQLRLAYEGASGTVNWGRVEAGAAVRRVAGRWTLSMRGDGGVDFSNSAPPQALFQLRSVDALTSEGPLPFTGDRAAVARGSVAYMLPLLNAQVRFRSAWLPAPAPSPYVGVQYGWTDAVGATRGLMDRFGWQTSNGARAAIDLGMRLFGGSLAVGAGRPLEAGGKWSFGLRSGIGN